jgi:Zn-dependent M28 family amino/carboxypeptidase
LRSFTYILKRIIPEVIIAILINGCHEVQKQEAVETAKKENTFQVPQFNADSAYRFVKDQVDFGPRVPSSTAHENCCNYLTGKLKSYNADVINQKANVTAYDGSRLPVNNIIARYKPGNPNRIFLAAHYDSRPWADHSKNPAARKQPIDGANDGASGVGVLLEVARLISNMELPVGVDIILFDAEDYGTPEFRDDIDKEDTWCLGSQYWAQHKHNQGYYARYGILLDMVGAKDATFCVEEFSKYYARQVVEKVWGIAADAGYSGYFLSENGGRVVDDHLYINKLANIPCIDIIQFDPGTSSNFPPAWHTENDNMSGIDKNTLKAVGQTLLEVIFREK